ncbi:unnamed protein product [Boreogadus saida]
MCSHPHCVASAQVSDDTERQVSSDTEGQAAPRTAEIHSGSGRGQRDDGDSPIISGALTSDIRDLHNGNVLLELKVENIPGVYPRDLWLPSAF